MQAAVNLFLFEHAHVHSRSVAPSVILNLEDLLCDGLTEDAMRRQPDEHTNSIVWLLWHMARSEDVGINRMLAGEREVFEEHDWAEEMNVRDRDVGTGMMMEDVTRISEQADLSAVRRYRRAVGDRTRGVVAELDWESLDDLVPDQRVDSAVRSEVFLPSASWVEGFWRGQPMMFFLWLATGHNYMHLQEAFIARDRCGSGLGL
jgi:hypothetical protein